MQLAKSVTHLASCLNATVNAGRLDISVLGAAMQKCGQLKCWGSLTHVRQVHKKSGLKLSEFEVSIYLKSLAECCRGKFGLLPDRQKCVVHLGQELWNESMPFNVNQACIGAAVAACAAASSSFPEASLVWAEELLAMAKTDQIQVDEVFYTPFLAVLAHNGLQHRVDDLLMESFRKSWSPNVVTLGNLINVYGERCEADLAEQLWNKLVGEHQIRPNIIAHRARAKAHILVGRPSKAIAAIEDMISNGFQLEQRSAEMLVQAGLILYHSSLAQIDKRLLTRSLDQADTVRMSSKRQVITMRSIFTRIQSSPRSVGLHDVLVTALAKRSILASLQSYEAGSGYLPP